MLETMRWVLWLEEEQRHLVWMRAERWGWKDIAGAVGCDRNTARRRWQRALAWWLNSSITSGNVSSADIM